MTEKYLKVIREALAQHEHTNITEVASAVIQARGTMIAAAFIAEAIENYTDMRRGRVG